MHKRWKWWHYERDLKLMTRMDQFQSFMERIEEPLFRRYEKLDGLGREEIAGVLQELRLDVARKNFLDIGPAYGTVIDFVREHGARSVEFVEYDPLFYTYNRLKGIVGYQVDVRKSLSVLPAGRYDLIWIKATYVADGFILQDSFLERLRYRYPRLEVLLNQIERLAARGGTIIFCPHWRSTDGERDLEDFMGTSLTRKFREAGYGVMRPIEPHNQSISPVTFYKKVV